MTTLEALKTYFGHDTFRPGQEEIVNALLSSKDVLAVMPTGGGKSICYQVPALLLPGITLVVSPLISLMKDQVRSLKEAGIPAAYLNASLTPSQIREALRRAALGRYKIIYVAPERLLTESFIHFAQSVDISLIAVDEAHCISQWGQDFRPSYFKIAEFIETLPKRPVLGAFTATATESVRLDIAHLLGLQNPFRITTGFDRQNLYFTVLRPKSKDLALLKLLDDTVHGNGIIYCATRKNVDSVCDMLHRNGFKVTKYHAGLEPDIRLRNQEDFDFDRAQIMVATNAFGMGIDKSDVSFVIHYNMPKSIEAYYQEAGRAGRDGSPAKCILLYSGADVHTNQYLIDISEPNPDLDAETQAAVKAQEKEKLKQMTYYCTTSQCLRAFLLHYFGEHCRPHCAACGNCNHETVETDCTAEAKCILQFITAQPFPIGKRLLSDAILGVNNERVHKTGLRKNPQFASLFDKSASFVENLLELLIADGYIGIDEGKYPTLFLTEDAKDILQNDLKIIMPVPVEKEKEKPSMSPVDEKLFRLLKQFCARIANLRGIPPYAVFTDATLRELATAQPRNTVQLLRISGIHTQKSKQYGKALLKIIELYQDEAEPEDRILQIGLDTYKST